MDLILLRMRVGIEVLFFIVGEILFYYIFFEWYFGIRGLFWGKMGDINKGFCKWFYYRVIYNIKY